MSQLPGNNTDSFASIAIIKEKKLLLKRMVMITRAIERMQDSLKSVLILGQPSTKIPKGMLKYFHILSDKIKKKPTKIIRSYLVKLEDLIKVDLQKIINISMLDPDVLEDEQAVGQVAGAYTDEAMDLLNEFKRQAQTAVSLKILLQQRGVYTPGSVVKVPVHLIKGQLKYLAKKEEIQRNKMKEHISDMHTDLKSMLDSDQYSDEMKSVFCEVISGLEDDQKAISDGARIDQLPMSFEVVESGEEPRDIISIPNMVVSEAEEYLVGIDQTESTEKAIEEMGFFRTLFKWLNTPWNVSWHDAKKGKSKGK